MTKKEENVQGVNIVQLDVSGYQQLKNIIDEQRLAIEKLRKEVHRLDNRIGSVMLDTCNPADWR